MRAKSDEVKKRDSKRRGAGDSDVEKCFENFYCSGNVVAVVVQWLRSVQLFVNPWTATQQTSPPFTISRSLLKLISIESVMSCNHLIFCCLLLLLPSIFPSIWVFSQRRQTYEQIEIHCDDCNNRTMHTIPEKGVFNSVEISRKSLPLHQFS